MSTEEQISLSTWEFKNFKSNGLTLSIFKLKNSFAKNIHNLVSLWNTSKKKQKQLLIGTSRTQYLKPTSIVDNFDIQSYRGASLQDLS